LAGNTVGKYRVIRKLGQGGMAHVYLAEDTTLKRRIALKVLDASRATDKHFVARFQREASTAAGLKHPNIVTIYEVGELDGLYFIAMEYVEGQTLKDMLTDAQKRNQPLELDTAVKIVGQVAEALTYAYRTEQIVHRDVKPANIMVDQACHVTLTDFGIARALSDQSDLTSAGGLIGTPFYMSPEHAASGVIDHRSDIYSLGVVLYQMLT
jgi:serine/threonine-protein kinase